VKPQPVFGRSKSVVGAEAGRGPEDRESGAPRGSSPEREAERAEERELVRRAQGGDQAAFRRLVERHGDRAYALALRILRSTSDAEEVAQDALVRAWRSLPRFRGDSAFSSWLYRIVARQSFDRAAVLKARRNRETGIEGVEDLPAEAAGPAADPEGRERAIRLEQLVAGLSEVPRTVVTLYYYQDRSVAEVARTLKMPENTVKTHLSRARAALRVGWTREDAPDPPQAVPGHDEEPR
jgi:RNA polymerase sigma-70 factor, ECF subfamily